MLEDPRPALPREGGRGSEGRAAWRRLRASAGAAFLRERQAYLGQRLEGRAGEMIALDVADAHRPERVELGGGLDALGDHGDAEIDAQADDRGDDHPARQAGVDAADQLHVELDDVRLEAREQVEPGVAGAEIVERGAEAHLPIGRDDVRDMRRIGHLLVLGELEHEPVGRQAGGARGAQRQLDAGGGRIDRVGQEIDRQARAGREDAGADGGLDRLDAALLVEGVAIGLRHAREHARGALPRGAADQRLIGEGRARDDVDDRLERHREGEVQACAVATCGAAACWGNGVHVRTMGARA